MADVSLLTVFATIVAASALAFTIGSIRRRRSTGLPYPPGPKPLLLLGNALDLPSNERGPTFVEWGKTYDSDILHASAFGSHIVVINNKEIAEDLLEKRAGLYSDRPEIPASNLMGLNDINTGLLRYGDLWRDHRRFLQQSFNRKDSDNWRYIIVECVKKLLRGLCTDPDHFMEHGNLLSVGATLRIMCGHEPERLDDPLVTLTEKNIKDQVELLLPGSTMMNVIPILTRLPTWFPGAWAQRLAAKVREVTEWQRDEPFRIGNQLINNGAAKPSLVTDFLERKATIEGDRDLAYEEGVVKGATLTLFAAASDTTSILSEVAFYVIAKHPDIQRRAQAELDRVVGFGRLPTWGDRESLPYVEAIYREVLRFSPPVPLGLPHASTSDDTYNGYFIHKDTTVIANIWAMTRNEGIYGPHTDSFIPDRHFNLDGSLKEDDTVLAFGFGRRVCVGRHVASDLGWLLIASVLACFNLGKAKDQFGNEIEMNDSYTDHGLLRHKDPFQCQIVPRSREIREDLEAE